jgi:hypothetical protein
MVEVFEFETGDPALRGVMTMTTTLADARRQRLHAVSISSALTLPPCRISWRKSGGPGDR